MALAKPSDIVGGTQQENASITMEILQGVQGPKRDIVVLNAACALYISGAAATLAQGITLAQQSIDSGAALAKLQELKTFTQSEINQS